MLWCQNTRVLSENLFGKIISWPLNKIFLTDNLRDILRENRNGCNSAPSKFHITSASVQNHR
jgi:hypothetical protein